MTTPVVTTVPSLLHDAHRYIAQNNQRAAFATAVMAQDKPVGRYTSSDALTLRGIPVVGPLPDLASARREHARETHRTD
jgi:hypothetical protein